MFTLPTGMNFSGRLNGFCLLSCGPGYKYPGYPWFSSCFLPRRGKGKILNSTPHGLPPTTKDENPPGLFRQTPHGLPPTTKDENPPELFRQTPHGLPPTTKDEDPPGLFRQTALSTEGGLSYIPGNVIACESPGKAGAISEMKYRVRNILDSSVVARG